MKDLLIAIVLIIWFVITAMSVLTLIGLVLVISGSDSGEPTTWLKIGTSLAKSLTDEKR